MPKAQDKGATTLLDATEREQPAATPQTTALVTTAPDHLVQMFERLATNKDVDVEKLQRLIDMQELILRHNAEAAFNAAFSAMQEEIPEIDEHGAIRNRDGDIQSRYAKNEDIQKVLRPILHRHGFSLSFRTEWPDKTTVKVIGVLTHRDGHKRESEFLASADTSGNKNAIQALGSSISYGHRYTTADLLNITSREPMHGADDDGQTSEHYKAPEPPAGYAEWWKGMEGAAARGINILTAGFNDASKEFRAYCTRHDKVRWTELRKRASEARP